MTRLPRPRPTTPSITRSSAYTDWSINQRFLRSSCHPAGRSLELAVPAGNQPGATLVTVEEPLAGVAPREWDRLRTEHPGGVLIGQRYVSARQAERHRQLSIPYLDAAENAWLNLEEALRYGSGRRTTSDRRTTPGTLLPWVLTGHADTDVAGESHASCALRVVLWPDSARFLMHECRPDHTELSSTGCWPQVGGRSGLRGNPREASMW